MRMVHGLATLAIVALLSLTFPLSAQNAALTGTITDPQQAVIAVLLSNSPT